MSSEFNISRRRFLAGGRPGVAATGPTPVRAYARSRCVPLTHEQFRAMRARAERAIRPLPHPGLDPNHRPAV